MKTVFRQFLLPVIYGTLAAVLLLVPVQLSTPVNAQEPEAECWAVLVGVSDYKYLVGLSWADDDARDLASELSPAWGDDHVKLLTDSMATKRDIENAITNWLAQREDADDVVLFFWSGYSYSSGYLAPHDSLATSYDNDISADELDSWLGTLDSEKIVIMNLSGNLLNVLSGTGRIVLTPSAAGESYWYPYLLKHSVFTYYILEALREFEATDSDNNLELSVEEIFDYAGTRTTDYTASDPDLTIQHPQMSDRYRGELSLLIKVTADVEIDTAQETNILSIDGKTYSSGDLPVSFIWAPGSRHDFEAVSSVSGGSGIRYVFNSWDDGNASVSRTISRGGVYTASYTTQYYLTVESAYGEPEGGGWYNSGSTAAISVVTPIEGTATRRIFTGWSGDYSGTTASASVIMDGPKTVAASWRTDYLLTVESDYGEPKGGGWYSSGSTATISVVTPIEGTATRHIFTRWSGDYSRDKASASIIMDEPKTVTANWRNDYLLTVESAYGEPKGGGWYNSGLTAAISVTSPEGTIVRKVFTGWSGDYSGATTPASVIMDGPKTVTANWRTDYVQLYMIIIGTVVILGALGVWLIRIRRGTVDIPLKGPAQSPTPATRCASCGAEIEPGDAFCVKCGKPVQG